MSFPVILGGVGLYCAARTIETLFFRPQLPVPWYAFGRFMGKFNEQNLDVDPNYFNPAPLSWVPELEANWTTIRDELNQFLATDQKLNPYFNDTLISKPGCWKVIGLLFWGIENRPVSRQFPKTMDLFNRIPGLVSVSFSQLEGGTTINPHNGDTNAHMRCHMGIDVPKGLPECGFQVGGEKRAWENGKVFLFCDAQNHTAFNMSDRDRTIVLFDVMRPEYLSQQHRVCSTVLAALMMQKVFQFWPSLRKHMWLVRIFYEQFRVIMLFPVYTTLGSASIFKILS